MGKDATDVLCRSEKHEPVAAAGYEFCVLLEILRSPPTPKLSEYHEILEPTVEIDIRLCLLQDSMSLEPLLCTCNQAQYPRIWREMGGSSAVDNTLFKKWRDVNEK